MAQVPDDSDPACVTRKRKVDMRPAGASPCCRAAFRDPPRHAVVSELDVWAVDPLLETQFTTLSKGVNNGLGPRDERRDRVGGQPNNVAQGVLGIPLKFDLELDRDGLDGGFRRCFLMGPKDAGLMPVRADKAIEKSHPCSGL